MRFLLIPVLCVLFAAACSNPSPESRIPLHYRLNVGENQLTFEQQMYYLAAALEIYRLHTGAYPSSEHSLDALIASPDILEGTGEWYGPYAESERFFYDPWENRIQYRKEQGLAYDLRSLGQDGIESDDDLAARNMMPDLYREMDKLAEFGPVSPSAENRILE